MWKFLEDLRNDFQKGIDDLADEQVSKEQISQTQQDAFDRGRETIKGDQIVALENGTVELVNQNQDQIEIYMDNGQGYGIKFPFGPTAYTVKVSPNEKVKKGQTLITFGPNVEHNVQVYAFTPDMIKLLSHSRFRID